MSENLWKPILCAGEARLMDIKMLDSRAMTQRGISLDENLRYNLKIYRFLGSPWKVKLIYAD